MRAVVAVQRLWRAHEEAEADESGRCPHCFRTGFEPDQSSDESDDDVATASTYSFTRHRRRRRGVTDTHDHGGGAATDGGGQGFGLPGVKICLAVKVSGATFCGGFVLRAPPASRRPPHLTLRAPGGAQAARRQGVFPLRVRPEASACF